MELFFYSLATTARSARLCGKLRLHSPELPIFLSSTFHKLSIGTHIVGVQRLKKDADDCFLN